MQFKDIFFKERETSQNSKIHKEYLLQSSKFGNLLVSDICSLKVVNKALFDKFLSFLSKMCS